MNQTLNDPNTISDSTEVPYLLRLKKVQRRFATRFTSLNNLLLAYDKGQSKPKEVNKIIKKDSWLNPKNFIEYQLKNVKS